MGSRLLLVACALGLLHCHPCDPSTCAGCCDATGACVASSDSACGSGGSACAACQSGQGCVSGECVQVCVGGDACTLGATRCEGDQVDTCIKSNGCTVWSAAAACPSGQLCEAASQTCQKGCSAANCTGCCSADTCVPLETETNGRCGPSGALCSPCRINEYCDTPNGVCHPSRIEHVVLIVQENHSFDTYFGRYCMAPAHSAPTCTTGRACCEAAPALEPSGASPGVLDDASNFGGDRDHGQVCELQQINGGLMNRYVSGASGSMSCFGTGPNCSSPNNWVLADTNTVGAYWLLADKSALADRYFQPIAGGSASNDMYFAGAHYRFIDNDDLPSVTVGEDGDDLCDVPFCLGGAPVPPYPQKTIGDLLLGGGYSFAMYADGYGEALAAGAGSCASKTATSECPYSDCLVHPEACYGCLYDPSDFPFLYFNGFTDTVTDAGKPVPTPHEKDLGALQTDLNAGTLPSFAFVKLRLFHNEHPNVSKISDGVTAVTGLLDMISQSPLSSSTLVLLTWDEGGGFFDHVSPPPSPPLGFDSDSSGKAVPYGTRVPFLAIGPFARTGGISHVPLEHSSIVRFLEFNFLGKEGGLGARDEVVNNLGSLLSETAVGVEVPVCNASCSGRTCGENGCGISCGACAPGSGCSAGSCVACTVPGNGACTTSGSLFCGSACCDPMHPFYCATNATCHDTADNAAAACGATCAACVPACLAAVATGSCASGHVNCAGTCCPSASPYYCAANSTCYATSADALASPCGAACVYCH